jgi:hypothetical protein
MKPAPKKGSVVLSGPTGLKSSYRGVPLENITNFKLTIFPNLTKQIISHYINGEIAYESV